MVSKVSSGQWFDRFRGVNSLIGFMVSKVS